MISKDTVIEQIPGYDIVDLGDGRLLVRHAGGHFLLPGLTREELLNLLAVVDGQRTLAEVAAAVEGQFEFDDVRQVLSALLGDIVRCRPVADSTGQARAQRLQLVGQGPLTERLSRHLASLGVAVRVHSWLDEPDAEEVAGTASKVAEDIWLLVGEDIDYATLLRWQGLARHGHWRALFVTMEPDGPRIGPWLQPRGPCLACVRGHELAFLESHDALLEVLESLRCGSVGALLETASSAVVSQLREALFNTASNASVATVLRLTESGRLLRSQVGLWPACPLCSVDAVSESRDKPPAAVASSQEAPEGGGVRRVGIVGGGTAGHLAALALRRAHPDLEVTLIEARDVPIIGVGEATTPLMPQFLHVDLGLSVHRLFQEVKPTLKQGIRFHWGPGKASRFNFPFGPMDLSAPGKLQADLDQVSLRSMAMSANRLAPSVSADGGALMDPWLAYHLDNRPFVEYLRRRAAARGVTSLDAHIVDVELAPDGAVAGLLARDGRRFDFDLYIDCSGFASLLMGGAQASPFVDFAASLPTDRALVGQTSVNGEIRPYTLATAMAHGWCWSTPQRDTDHRGYVYSSAFTHADQAEREMRRLVPGLGSVHEVRFRAGRRQHFWHRNVVALGNAYGFVEPLESTALHMLIRQVGLLVAALPDQPVASDLFNRRVAGWWDYLRWFLALHFRFNRAWDSEFWRYCREHVDVSAYAELIEAFQKIGPLSGQRPRSIFDLPDPLWGVEGIDLLLLGQGVSWPTQPRQKSRPQLAGAPGQRDWLEHLARQPKALESWVQTLRTVGPAFPKR